MNSDVVLRHLLFADSHHLNKIIALGRLRWPRHVRHMPDHRLSRRNHSARDGQGWQKRRVGQAITCHGGMYKFVLVLVSVNEDYCWLETLSGMAQNGSRWCDLCAGCLWNSSPLKIIRKQTKEIEKYVP